MLIINQDKLDEGDVEETKKPSILEQLGFSFDFFGKKPKDEIVPEGEEEEPDDWKVRLRKLRDTPVTRGKGVDWMQQFQAQMFLRHKVGLNDWQNAIFVLTFLPWVISVGLALLHLAMENTISRSFRTTSQSVFPTIGTFSINKKSSIGWSVSADSAVGDLTKAAAFANSMNSLPVDLGFLPSSRVISLYPNQSQFCEENVPLGLCRVRDVGNAIGSRFLYGISFENVTFPELSMYLSNGQPKLTRGLNGTVNYTVGYGERSSLAAVYASKSVISGYIREMERRLFGSSVFVQLPSLKAVVNFNSKATHIWQSVAPLGLSVVTSLGVAPVALSIVEEFERNLFRQMRATGLRLSVYWSTQIMYHAVWGLLGQLGSWAIAWILVPLPRQYVNFLMWLPVTTLGAVASIITGCILSQLFSDVETAGSIVYSVITGLALLPQFLKIAGFDGNSNPSAKFLLGLIAPNFAVQDYLRELLDDAYTYSRAPAYSWKLGGQHLVMLLLACLAYMIILAIIVTDFRRAYRAFIYKLKSNDKEGNEDEDEDAFAEETDERFQPSMYSAVRDVDLHEDVQHEVARVHAATKEKQDGVIMRINHLNKSFIKPDPLGTIAREVVSTKKQFDTQVKRQAEKVKDKTKDKQYHENAANALASVLRLERLKIFDLQHFTAVTNLSFMVKKDEVFVLLGPNGAGKTTTMEMILGGHDPTHGVVDINGISMRHDRDLACEYIGYCPQFDRLWDLLSFRDHLYYYGMLKGLSWERVELETEIFLEMFHLGEKAERPTVTYNGGAKRKCSFAIACMGSPDLIILDEPTTGMDVAARRELWDIIAEVSTGRAMLVSTHYMDEAEAIHTRLGIMCAGSMRCIGNGQYLKSKFGSGYKIALKSNKSDMQSIRRLRLWMRTHLPASTFQSVVGQVLEFQIPQEEVDLARIFAMIEKDKFSLDIEDFSVSQNTMEDVFMKFASEDDEEDAKKGKKEDS